MVIRRVVCLLAVVVAVAGCAKVREIAGLPVAGEPSVTLRSAENRWLLIKNPRFGDVASEPEYVWVEEDKVPTTITTLLRGKSAIIAPPEIVAKYGPPPGGGRISPRQKMPQAATEPPRVERSGRVAAVAGRGGPVAAAAAPAVPEPKRGFVVFVDTTRIVVDLTSADGLHPGTVLSLRRDQIPIVHPVTGEVLGELDEEVATAKVTETRDKFSVAEIQKVSPGFQVQVKDRAVPK